ncbi:uncharacterized protein V6R79_020804 [Siganus canaliculatus]
MRRSEKTHPTLQIHAARKPILDAAGGPIRLKPSAATSRHSSSSCVICQVLMDADAVTVN